MKIIKMETEHLICYLTKDGNGEEYHQIYEKSGLIKPIVIYINPDDIRTAEELPENLTEYKYIKELCKLIKCLTEDEED